MVILHINYESYGVDGMTEKELKKLSRADLLEMLISQSEELQQTRQKLAEAEAALQKREIALGEAGSIAEAAIQINGVFEAAQAASQQYLENIRQMQQRQEAVSAQLERESRQLADRRIAEMEKKCEAMETEAKIASAEMVKKAKAESQAYWDEVSARLEAFYQEHAGLRELLLGGASGRV